jgi:hypothetical protein
LVCLISSGDSLPVEIGELSITLPILIPVEGPLNARAREVFMSEKTVCVCITFLVIALMFAWVPVLEFVCPRCSRALERLRSKKLPKARRHGDASG